MWNIWTRPDLVGSMSCCWVCGAAERQVCFQCPQRRFHIVSVGMTSSQVRHTYIWIWIRPSDHKSFNRDCCCFFFSFLDGLVYCFSISCPGLTMASSLCLIDDFCHFVQSSLKLKGETTLKLSLSADLFAQVLWRTMVRSCSISWLYQHYFSLYSIWTCYSGNPVLLYTVTVRGLWDKVVSPGSGLDLSCPYTAASTGPDGYTSTPCCRTSVCGVNRGWITTKDITHEWAFSFSMTHFHKI